MGIKRNAALLATVRRARPQCAGDLVGEAQVSVLEEQLALSGREDLEQVPLGVFGGIHRGVAGQQPAVQPHQNRMAHVHVQVAGSVARRGDQEGVHLLRRRGRLLRLFLRDRHGHLLQGELPQGGARVGYRHRAAGGGRGRRGGALFGPELLLVLALDGQHLLHLGLVDPALFNHDVSQPLGVTVAAVHFYGQAELVRGDDFQVNGNPSEKPAVVGLHAGYDLL
jgi:hypothetical protein